MEESNRKPFQGTLNIIRFNWHFYLIALVLILILQVPGILTGSFQISGARNMSQVATAASILSLVVLGLIFISLAVSAYIYDLSDLYSLHWIKTAREPRRIINIHAGFDETSNLIRKKFPDSKLEVFDFYDPEKHTEISIKRARNAYPSFPGTRSVSSNNIPLDPSSAELVLLLFSAHEIRDQEERIRLFSQIKEALHDGGKVLVAEHLRDLPNFLAYSFGFLHFLPKKTWTTCFIKAGFEQFHTEKLNPFITLYTLQKNGASS